LHIVACIKMVPDTTLVKVDPVTNTLVREGIPFITNPFDDHAVEEALSLRDRYGGHVTVISMGPLPAVPVIRRAMARGADAGILVSDRLFGGSDTLATSRILAAAVKRLSEEQAVDLVVCGKQTIDGDTGQVGPGMATRLGYAQVSLVERVLEVAPGEGVIRARVKLDDQYEVVEARMPALITVVREINRPRYPAVAGRLRAEEEQIPVWNNEVLKLAPGSIGLKGSPTWVRRIFAPERRVAERVEGLGERRRDAVARIVEKLEAWKIIGPSTEG
jgi:electron transfer flavoprotein beta subunit